MEPHCHGERQSRQHRHFARETGEPGCLTRRAVPGRPRPTRRRRSAKISRCTDSGRTRNLCTWLSRSWWVGTRGGQDSRATRTTDGERRRDPPGSKVRGRRPSRRCGARPVWPLSPAARRNAWPRPAVLPLFRAMRSRCRCSRLGPPRRGRRSVPVCPVWRGQRGGRGRTQGHAPLPADRQGAMKLGGLRLSLATADRP